MLKPGRNAIRFFYCLVLSALLWLFIAMNDEHLYKVPVNLRYNFIGNTINKNPLPTNAELHVTASGWKLIKALFIERTVTIEVNKEQVFIAEENISLLTRELPTGMQINSIEPDSIRFEIDEKLSKKVPVMFNSRIETEDSTFQVSKISLTPDSLVITGPKSSVEKYNSWQTELLFKKQVQESFIGTVALIQKVEENITLSAIAVQYQVKVDEYKERVFEVEPQSTGPEFEKAFELPGKILVKCLLPVVLSDSISANVFKVTIHRSQGSDTLKYEVTDYPVQAKNIEIHPAYILIRE
ncbi:MAG: hypothetical protein ACKVPJ_04515 [Chitinophagales bacterium]